MLSAAFVAVIVTVPKAFAETKASTETLAMLVSLLVYVIVPDPSPLLAAIVRELPIVIFALSAVKLMVWR
jgi:hypothetical protein